MSEESEKVVPLERARKKREEAIMLAIVDRAAERARNADIPDEPLEPPDPTPPSAS